MNGRAAFKRGSNERPVRVAADAASPDNPFSGRNPDSMWLGCLRFAPRDLAPPQGVRRVAPLAFATPGGRRSLLNGRVFRALRISLRRKAAKLRATEGGANAYPSVCVSSCRHVRKHGAPAWPILRSPIRILAEYVA